MWWGVSGRILAGAAPSTTNNGSRPSDHGNLASTTTTYDTRRLLTPTNETERRWRPLNRGASAPPSPRLSRAENAFVFFFLSFWALLSRSLACLSFLDLCLNTSPPDPRGAIRETKPWACGLHDPATATTLESSDLASIEPLERPPRPSIPSICPPRHPPLSDFDPSRPSLDPLTPPCHRPRIYFGSYEATRRHRRPTCSTRPDPSP